MIDNRIDSDVHLSRVAQWVMNTLGRALGLSVGVAFLFVFAGWGVGQTWVIALAGLFGPITFACVLESANAPVPHDRD